RWTSSMRANGLPTGGRRVPRLVWSFAIGRKIRRGRLLPHDRPCCPPGLDAGGDVSTLFQTLPDAGEVEIIRGDALDLIEVFPAFDLLVTDPPYAFGGQGTDEWALSATVAVVLRESAKRLRRGGWAVIFAAQSWRSTSYMIEAVRGVLEPVRFGTWAKPEARSKVRTPG